MINIKNLYQQTTGLLERLNNNIQRLNNNIQLSSIGVIVSEKFVSVSVFFFVYKFVLYGKQVLARQIKGNRVKHILFSQSIPVWRMSHLELP